MRIRTIFPALLSLCLLAVLCRAQPRQPANRTRTIPAGQLQVHIAQYGQGEPLFLLHAGYLDGRMWDKQVAFFRDYYRVIVIDQPGHGQTTGSDTVALIADVLRTVMDSLHILHASFVGLSIGSASVMDFVLAYPERVNKLVLVSPGLSGWAKVMKADSFSLNVFRNMDSVVASGNRERIAQNFADLWCVGPFRAKDSVDAGAREYVYRTALTRLEKHAIRDGPVFNESGAATRLSSIQKSTFIIAGDKDVPFILSAAAYIHRQIKNSRLMIIPGVAHMLNLERPNDFNRAVLFFLQQK
jgi:3-oxoadipate enol-lactonase